MSNKFHIPKQTILLISLILGFCLIYPNIAKLIQENTAYSEGVGALEHAAFSYSDTFILSACVICF